MDIGTINYRVFLDGKEMLGTANVTLPNTNFIMQTVNGAGLGGNMEYPLRLLEAMELGIAFNNSTENATKLSAPETHHIELRSAQECYDQVHGKLGVDAIKHVFEIMPKTHTGGQMAPASQVSASGTYAVHYWKEMINGKELKELDPVHFICKINGTDYLADARKALGY
jgi:hypothetical protein